MDTSAFLREKWGVGLKLQKNDSLGTILFDLKEAGPFSWVGQNARTKSVIKPKKKATIGLWMTTLSYNDPTTTTIGLKKSLPLDYISLSLSSFYIQHHLHHSLINNPYFFLNFLY